MINIQDYEKQISDDYHAEWFLLKDKPRLIFDHDEMVELAKKQLRYKAAFHPVLFELLPEKFVPFLGNRGCKVCMKAFMKLFLIIEILAEKFYLQVY